MKHVRHEPKLREVTTEQLRQGYLVLGGAIARYRAYIVHHKTSHQTFVVYDPESIEGWPIGELPKLEIKEPEFED